MKIIASHHVEMRPDHLERLPNIVWIWHGSASVIILYLEPCGARFSNCAMHALSSALAHRGFMSRTRTGVMLSSALIRQAVNIILRKYTVWLYPLNVFIVIICRQNRYKIRAGTSIYSAITTLQTCRLSGPNVLPNFSYEHA